MVTPLNDNNQKPALSMASSAASLKNQVSVKDYPNKLDYQRRSGEYTQQKVTPDETLHPQEIVGLSAYIQSGDSRNTTDITGSTEITRLLPTNGFNHSTTNYSQLANTNGNPTSSLNPKNESNCQKVWFPSTSNPIINDCRRSNVDDSGGTFIIHESPHYSKSVNSLNEFLPSQLPFPDCSNRGPQIVPPNAYQSMTLPGFNGNFMSNALNDHCVPFVYPLPEPRHTWPNIANGLFNTSYTQASNPALGTFLSPALNEMNTGDVNDINNSNLMLLSALIAGNACNNNQMNMPSYIVPNQDVQLDQRGFSGRLNMPYETPIDNMNYPNCQVNPMIAQTGTMLDMLAMGTGANSLTDPNNTNFQFPKHQVNRKNSYIRPCAVRSGRPNNRRYETSMRRSMPPPIMYRQHPLFPNRIPSQSPHAFHMSNMENVINSLFEGQSKNLNYTGRSQIGNEFPNDGRLGTTHPGSYAPSNQFIRNNNNKSSAQDSCSLRFPSTMECAERLYQTNSKTQINSGEFAQSFYNEQSSKTDGDMLTRRNIVSPISAANTSTGENQTSAQLSNGNHEETNGYCILAGKTLALLPNVCKDSSMSDLREDRYSRKVFVGGLPPDIDEEEIMMHFQRFGSLVVDWPHKAESKSYFPPKGYAFLIYSDERSVQDLIEACVLEDQKLYMCVSSPSINDKPVQIRPWLLSDSDYVMDGSQPLDPRKTIFVGGVPRPLRAGVCYAGIDTDPELKYPKGAGRVAFSNQQSYITAISARFMQLRHMDIDKRVEVKPYVLDDQMCDECRGARCNGKFAPFFCANVTCLQYYCESCWTAIHCRGGREFHKPLVKEGSDRPRSLIYRWS